MDDWAAEFRLQLPAPLKAFVESRAPEATRADHLKSIRERLKAILDLYKVSRYRPTTDGDLRITLTIQHAAVDQHGRARYEE